MMKSAVEFDCDPAWPSELNAEVESTLEALNDVAWHNEEVEIDQWIEGPEPPSGEPFCGCSTCATREMLTIAVIRTVEAVAAGRITIPGVVLTSV